MNPPSAHLLHVDDDPGDTVLMQQACRRAQASFELHSTADGEQAIAYLNGVGVYQDAEKFPSPQVVLLDLKMPRRDGFEVLAWIRHEARFKFLPVIIFTASNQEDDIRRAYGTGANSYLVKPVGITTLIEMVKTIDFYWFRLNQSPGALPAPAQRPVGSA